MTPDYLAELALIDASRIQRELWGYDLDAIDRYLETSPNIENFDAGISNGARIMSISEMTGMASAAEIVVLVA